MLEWSFGRFRLRFTFSFFALVGLAASLGSNVQPMMVQIIVCSLLHELGHIFAMCLFGICPGALTFCAGGIRLSEECLACRKWKRAFILLAGCAVNLSLSAAGVVFGLGDEFSAVNLILGIFNLLPFRYFDGGRLYSELTGREPPFLLRAAALLPLAAAAALSVAEGELPVPLIAAMAIMLADG